MKGVVGQRRLVVGRQRLVVGRILVVGLIVVVGMMQVVGLRAHLFDLSGKWRMAIEMSEGRGTPLLTLTEKDGKLTGTYTGRYGASPVEGTVDGKKVAFSIAMSTMSLAFKGEIKDDGTLAGTADFGEMGEVTWTAAREK